MRSLAIVLILLLLLALVIGGIGCISCTSGLAKVEDIYASRPNLDLGVALSPTGPTEAEKQYVVDLYEKDELRASAIISWSVAELDDNKTKTVHFPLTSEEFWRYCQKDVRHIFSVKVHE